MSKIPKTTQRIYSLTKKREYTNTLNSSLRTLRKLEIDPVVYKSTAKDLISYVRKLDDSSAGFLTSVSKDHKKHLLHDVTINVSSIFRGRFIRTIKELWSNTYDLGKRHSVTDLMFTTGLFNNQFKRKADFNSLDGFSLVDIYEDDIAEFAESEDLTPAQRKAITRAKRNLTILRNNVNKLKTEGVLYDDFDLEKGSSKAARLTIEERIRFLEMVQEIDDLLRKAEASEKAFLSDEYLQRRYRVLTQDYASMYDNYIKDQLATYLDKNIEGVRQIRNTEANAEQLANTIANQIQNAQVELVKPSIKAEMILRTELSLAYNFGKLLGFTSPTDLNRKFRWNADWELEGKADYEVCQACAKMDGRIYTVQDLLTVGTRLDRGVLRYEGKTRTDFKNPTMPMIPFHPCLSEGVKISLVKSDTPELCYYKNIEEVKVGDYVVVPTENKYEKVTKVFKNWTEDYIYDIRTDSGQKLHITGNHPIWTGVDWKDAECIRVGDIITIGTIKNTNLSSTSNNKLFNVTKYKPDSCEYAQRYSSSNENSESIQYQEKSKREQRFVCEHPGESSKKLRTNEEKQSQLCSRNTCKNDCYTKEELRRPGISQTNCTSATEEQLPQQSRSRSKKISSYLQPQSKTEMEGTNAGNWIIASSLQKFKWTKQVQGWVSRRFTALFQKWMGSECGSNSKYTSNELGVRKANRVIRWENILSRFLSNRLGCVHRSKRLLDRRCETKAQPVTSRVSESENSFSRFLNVQGFDKEFQGLMPVRVVSIERYKNPQYVYNLEVENANVYFANDILVHNCCNCYWDLMPDDDPVEDYAERYVDTTIPPPLPAIPGTVQDVQKIQDQTIPITVGTGLLVGGLFLLARSNVWRLFYRTAVQSVDDVAKTTPVQQFINVSEFITKETPGEVSQRFDEVFETVIKTRPEELPVVVEPVLRPSTPATVP